MAADLSVDKAEYGAGLYEVLMLDVPDYARMVADIEAIHDAPSSATAYHEKGHSFRVELQKDLRTDTAV